MSAAGWASSPLLASSSSASPRRCSGGTWPRCTAAAPARRSTACSSRWSGSSTAACRVDPEREQRWTVYALVGARVQRRRSRSCSTRIQRLQGSLPFNPTDMPEVAPALAFNTAVSFMTNTNWQSYYPEIDAEPPHPDGRPHGAELRLGRRRAWR